MTVECLVPVASWHLSPAASSVLHSVNIPETPTVCLVLCWACEGLQGPGCPPWGSPADRGDREWAQRQILYEEFSEGCGLQGVRTEQSEKASWRRYVGPEGWVKL